MPPEATSNLKLPRRLADKRVVLLGGGGVALAVLLAAGAIHLSTLLGPPQGPPGVTEVASANPSATTTPHEPTEPHRLDPPHGIDKVVPPEKPAGRAPLTVEEERQLRAGASFRECDACPDMVAAPAGDFLMGSPDAEPGRMKFEGPIRKVTLAHSIAVGRHAVTRDEFQAFVDATAYAFGNACHVQASTGWIEKDRHSFLSPPDFSQEGDHPAVCVSWKDAEAYVRWLSARTGRPYRLPSEAEREYVARAGTSTPYWWGQEVSAQQANFDTQPRLAASPRDTTAPGWGQRVPSKPGEPPAAPRIAEPGVAAGGTRPVAWGQPNPWGFFQVHGNVAEWVQDCWNPDYARTPIDGSAARTGDCSLRVVRGGAWSSWPEDIRAAYREMAGAEERYYSIGFRVARDIRR
jgi:formylglycine-generating enzyme required for sulfatase activity